MFSLPHVLPTQKVLVIEDALFEKITVPKNLSFTVKPLSALLGTSMHRDYSIRKSEVIAFIRLNTEFALSPRTGQSPTHTQLSFVIDVNSFVVSSETDEAYPTLNKSGGQKTISVSTVEDVPKNHIALAIDGTYVGEEQYPLKTQTRAICTIYNDSFFEHIHSFCKKVFVETPEEKTTFVACVGDLMVARGIQEILINDSNGLEYIFNDTLPILQNNDITLGNLEGAVTESSTPIEKTYRFKFKKEVLPFLQKAGFTYLSLANNHCYDYGEQGFKDTLEAFKEYNIQTSGAGFSKEEAIQFYRTTIRGNTYAIISCGAFPTERSGFDGKTMATATETRAGILWADESIFELIKSEKSKESIVIVCVHGGYEYVTQPSAEQRALYRAFCDYGADIVFGSHPHVVQASEMYHNSLIVYSLGNFLFNGMQNLPGATDTEIVRVGFYQGKILYTEVYPAHIQGVSVFLK